MAQAGLGNFLPLLLDGLRKGFINVFGMRPIRQGNGGGKIYMKRGGMVLLKTFPKILPMMKVDF